MIETLLEKLNEEQINQLKFWVIKIKKHIMAPVTEDARTLYWSCKDLENEIEQFQNNKISNP